MKCLYYNCDAEANEGYPCCSMTHGVKFTEDKKTYEDYAFEMLPLSNWYSNTSPGSWTILKWEYMSKV